MFTTISKAFSYWRATNVVSNRFKPTLDTTVIEAKQRSEQKLRKFIHVLLPPLNINQGSKVWPWTLIICSTRCIKIYIVSSFGGLWHTDVWKFYKNNQSLNRVLWPDWILTFQFFCTLKLRFVLNTIFDENILCQFIINFLKNDQLKNDLRNIHFQARKII